MKAGTYSMTSGEKNFLKFFDAVEVKPVVVSKTVYEEV